MCEVNQTDTPDPADQTKEKHYAGMKEKLHAAQIRHQGGMGAYEAQTPCVAAPGLLRDRVGNAFHRASSESRKLDRLRELATLLDSNPAVARILELIEETRV